MKFILFVEGHTEASSSFAGFLKRWLDPRLAHPVRISPIRFEGWPDLVKAAPGRAEFYLRTRDGGEIIGIIGLMDLYGPTIYPPHLNSASERFDWIKQHMEQKVRQAKFRQFCAVHETEAWLLSQPELFPRNVREAFSDRVQKPETINFDAPPSHLLNQLYRLHTRRIYKKRVDGAGLFAQADPAVVYEKCPHFRQMLDEMLVMAKAAGL